MCIRCVRGKRSCLFFRPADGLRCLGPINSSTRIDRGVPFPLSPYPLSRPGRRPCHVHATFLCVGHTGGWFAILPSEGRRFPSSGHLRSTCKPLLPSKSRFFPLPRQKACWPERSSWTLSGLFAVLILRIETGNRLGTYLRKDKFRRQATTIHGAMLASRLVDWRSVSLLEKPVHLQIRCRE